MKHNLFPKEGMPVFILFKAMCGLSDKEITNLILRDTVQNTAMFKLLLPSIEQCIDLKVLSEINALEYIGKRISLSKETTKLPASIAFDVIYNSVLTHIPMVNHSFYSKVFYLAFMMRRLLLAHIDPDNHIDNRDFYGNKRLELAGTLIGFVFEDALKRYNSLLMVSTSSFLSFILLTFIHCSQQPTDTCPR